MENKIEILMATYNGESYIAQQIDSILQQTHSNLKLIICDDLSTDSTPSIINQYAAQYPDKIAVIKTEKKLGGNQCFSFLLGHSKAKYIMFSDQDDIWIDNKVERTLNEMHKLESKYGTDTPLLVHTDLIVVDEKLNRIHNSFWAYSKLFPSKTSLNRLLVQNVVTGCTVMINRAAATAAHPFPETIVQHDWWLALVATCLGQIRHISEPLIYYRQHGANSIGAKRFNFIDYWKRINKTGPQEENYRIKNKAQALALKARLGSKIEILDKFLTINDLNFMQLIFTCIKYKFCFHGVLRNLGVFTKKLRQAAFAKMG